MNSRKEAIREYKERKVPRGVFVVKCAATGSVWVDSAMDLEVAERRTLFVLRHGDKFMDKSIQEEFQAHGIDAFRFEVVEKIDEDTPQMSLRDVLKQRKLHWIEKLAAKKLTPV